MKPPYPPRFAGVPGGQQNQGHGVVLHDQEEEHQKPITPRNGSIKVSQGEVPREACKRKSQEDQDDQDASV